MPIGRAIRVWPVQGSPSRKTGVTPTWEVIQFVDGSFTCNCPSWCKNTPRTDCKHILKIKLTLATMTGLPPIDSVVQPPVVDLPKRRIKK